MFIPAGVCSRKEEQRNKDRSWSEIWWVLESQSATLFDSPLNHWGYRHNDESIIREANFRAKVSRIVFSGVDRASVKFIFHSHPAAVFLLVWDNMQSLCLVIPASISTQIDVMDARNSSNFLWFQPM